MMTISFSFIALPISSFWTWFFWQNLHPLIAVVWLAFCLISLWLSIELSEQTPADTTKKLPHNLPNPSENHQQALVTSIMQQQSHVFKATEKSVATPPTVIVLEGRQLPH